MAAEALYDEALAMDSRSRAKLARLLLESLESERDDDADAAWSDELSRRAAQVGSGEVSTVTWDDARAAIRRELGRRRANRSSP